MTRQERALVALHEVVESLVAQWASRNRPSTMVMGLTDLVVLEELCGAIDDEQDKE